MAAKAKWTPLQGYKCPNCRSTHIQRLGSIPTLKGKKPRGRCADCGKTFYLKTVAVKSKKRGGKG